MVGYGLEGEHFSGVGQGHRAVGEGGRDRAIGCGDRRSFCWCQRVFVDRRVRRGLWICSRRFLDDALFTLCLRWGLKLGFCSSLRPGLCWCLTFKCSRKVPYLRQCYYPGSEDMESFCLASVRKYRS